MSFKSDSEKIYLEKIRLGEDLATKGLIVDIDSTLEELVDGVVGATFAVEKGPFIKYNNNIETVIIPYYTKTISQYSNNLSFSFTYDSIEYTYDNNFSWLEYVDASIKVGKVYFTSYDIGNSYNGEQFPMGHEINGINGTVDFNGVEIDFDTLICKLDFAMRNDATKPFIITIDESQIK